MTIEKNDRQKLYRCGLLLLWAILLLWRIPFLNLGIDYTDTGYSLTNYKNVFSGNGIRDIGLFWTTLIGGVLYKLLPAGQLLACRILHWLLYVAVDVVTYRMFRKYLKPHVILLALLALNLGSRSGEAIFGYYPLTKLLLLPAIALLLKGTVEKRNGALFFSGLLCGLNTFVRLPNALFCSMVLGVVFYGVWTKREKKEIWREFFAFLLGVLAGLAATLAVMVCFMGFGGIVGSFREYVMLALGKTDTKVENFLGIEETSGHSMLAILRTVAIQGVYALEDVALFGLPMLLGAFLIHFVWDKLQLGRPALKYAAIAVLEAAAIFLFRERIAANATVVAVLLMFAVAFVLLVAGKKLDPEHRLIYLLTVLLGLCCVFGSDLGLRRVGMLQGMILLVTILGVYDIKAEIHAERHEKFCRYAFLPALSLLLLAVLVTNVTVSIPKTFMDGDVGTLHAEVSEEIPALRGMKTSAVRAEELDEYYELMQAYPEQEVAIFGYFPLGYIIGPQRDYFESVQPCVDYPAVSVESLLGVMQEKPDVYPILVMSHVNRLQRGDDHDTSEAKTAVFEYMLTRTDYECVLDDAYFTIFVPGQG